MIRDKFTIIIIIIGIIFLGSVILFSRHKTTCKNTRTVHREYVSREVSGLFHLQKKFMYKKRRIRKWKEFRRSNQTIKLVKEIEEV